MSNLIPVFKYPSGNRISVPIGDNVIYKWIDSLGGERLSEPITYGTIRPDGRLAHGGVVTTNSNNIIVVDYHYQRSDIK